MESAIQEILTCEFLEPAWWLIFGANVPDIVLYTHLPNITLSLFLALFVLYQKPKGLPNRILFFTVLAFVGWVFFALMFWATNRADIILFAWLIDILLEPLVHIGILYLLYVLISGRDLRFIYKLGLILIYLPIPLLLSTPLTLESFDPVTCLATEGFIALYYTYFVESVVTIALIGFLGYRYFFIESPEGKRKVFYLGLGGILLLFSFSWGNIIGSFTENWEWGQYGLLGMPVFIGFLVYTIVRFKIFTQSVFATQALVVMTGFAIFALLFINNISGFRSIVSITLLVYAVMSYKLIESVKREITQRKEIERLAKKLEGANVRLKQLDQMKSEFVSIASHQLRSPLTSIRGYSSMLLEGSYGKLPPKAQETMQKIADSSRFMALSVEDYLNVSRIEAGNMKYNNADFNLKELAEKVADELRGEAIKKGLLLTFKSDVTSRGIVNADIGKVKQVIQNLVDNSMKYTPKGTVNIFVYDDKKKKRIYVDITDTGIGMSEHTLDSIFDKFERAHNANAVNVTGTGLGLYVAKKMAEAMGGEVEAKSEGEGKGSTFTIELPLAM